VPYCKQCGSSLRDGAKFCRGCGLKMTAIAPEAVAPAPAPAQVARPAVRPEQASPATRSLPYDRKKLAAVGVVCLIIATSVGMVYRQKRAAAAAALAEAAAQPKAIRVPSLVGRTEGEAQDQVTAADPSLRLVVAERESSETVGEGQIIRQKSAPDSTVTPGAAVEVTVSSGPAEQTTSQTDRSGNVQWTGYKAPSEGYRIDYPAGWTLHREVNPGRTRTTFTAPDSDVSFLVDTSRATSADAYKSWEEIDRSLSRRYGENYVRLGLTRTSQSSDSPALLTFTLAAPDHVTLQRTDFGLVRHGRGYAILATAPVDHWSEWEKVFDHVRESLQIDAVSGSASPLSARIPAPTAASASAWSEYSEIHERRLTNADLAAHTNEELRLMRNTIFARHGYLFGDHALGVYFGGKSWYHGDTSSPDMANSRFSRIEKDNANLIVNYQKANGSLNLQHHP
jgi:hypothetical protein